MLKNPIGSAGKQLPKSATKAAKGNGGTPTGKVQQMVQQLSKGKGASASSSRESLIVGRKGCGVRLWV